MKKRRYYLSLFVIALYFFLMQHQTIYADEINELDYRRLIYINENGGSGTSTKWMYTIDTGGENDWETAGSWWDGLGAGGKYIDNTGNWHVVQDFTNSYTNQILIGEMFFQRVDCVGITPRLLLSQPSRDGYDFAGWTIDNGRMGEDHDGYTAFNVGCYAGNNLTFTAQWIQRENPTPVQTYPIDLNSYLDNEQHWDLNGFGTADVTINGIKVADDVADFCQTDFIAGTTYLVDDIKAKAGFAYTGPAFFSGTLTDSGAWLWPTFETLVTLDVNAYYNGVEQGYLSPWGTADVYINGNKVVEDGTDYYNVNISKGSNFLVNDIKANFGYDYTGPSSFSGVLTNPFTSVVLPFQQSIFTILFDPNGGQGLMKSIVVNGILLERLPSNTFTRTNDSGQSKFLGWSKDKNAKTPMYKENGQLIFTPGDSTITLFAIWDDCPVITVKDRYFTLYEAKKAVITETELLRTVTSTDREDGTTQIRVKNYAATTFTGLISSGVIMITYTTTDSRNNTIEKQIKVTIVDTDATKEGLMDFDGKKQYARFISADYFQKDYASGGLEATSKWKSDVAYRNTLMAAMNNMKGEDGNWSHVVKRYEFSKGDIEQVKQYVSNNGMGEFTNIDAMMKHVIK